MAFTYNADKETFEREMKLHSMRGNIFFIGGLLICLILFMWGTWLFLINIVK